MNPRTNKRFMRTGVALILACTTIVVLFCLVGCTEKLAGEFNPNQKPIVDFANIPPEGQNFSINPIIHWWGTDPDGLINRFRYHVATAAEVRAYADPLDYIATIPDNGTLISTDTIVYDSTPGGGSPDVDIVDVYSNYWTEIEVDHTDANPHMSDKVSMSADLSVDGNPVLNYISQFVFLQAYDNEGLGSDIVYRWFNRNDNPPQSFVDRASAGSLPFVNDEGPGGVNTGIQVSWWGEDTLDYPSDPPPFEFEWKLFGPYTNEELTYINETYFTKKYVAIDGRTFMPGDTVWKDTCDTTGASDTCWTIPVVADPNVTGSGSLGEVVMGNWVDFFYKDDPSKYGLRARGLYRVIDSSGPEGESWVLNTDTTIYNVFRNTESDTTVEMQFIFWVRSRDDAQVMDPTPGFRVFPALNPKFERTVAVLDYKGILTNRYNGYKDLRTSMTFWHDVIKKWGGQHSSLDTTTRIDELSGEEEYFFDTIIGRTPIGNSSRDYLLMEGLDGGLPLSFLMSHKVIIMYADGIQGVHMNLGKSLPVYRAIDAGVNVWVTARSPIGGADNSPLDELETFSVENEAYGTYFGVEEISFSATLAHAINGQRIEDFIGTYAVPVGWPTLAVDTALLHSRYLWSGVTGIHIFEWMDTVACLPEVNWSVRYPETEVLYLYKSKYGPVHFLSHLSFEAAPVGHRYETSRFRTAHFNFTPLSLGEDSMYVMVDSVLNWLYDPHLLGTLSAARYPGAKVKIDVAKATAAQRERNMLFDQKVSNAH